MAFCWKGIVCDIVCALGKRQLTLNNNGFARLRALVCAAEMGVRAGAGIKFKQDVAAGRAASVCDYVMCVERL